MNSLVVLVIGVGLMLIGLVQLSLARDKLNWRGYAVESFRYCNAAGFSILGVRLTWIFFYGDEPGISVWAQFGYGCLILGQLGLQMNNLQIKGDIHVPRFVRRTLTHE